MYCSILGQHNLTRCPVDVAKCCSCITWQHNVLRIVGRQCCWACWEREKCVVNCQINLKHLVQHVVDWKRIIVVLTSNHALPSMYVQVPKSLQHLQTNVIVCYKYLWMKSPILSTFANRCNCVHHLGFFSGVDHLQVSNSLCPSTHSCLGRRFQQTCFWWSKFTRIQSSTNLGHCPRCCKHMASSWHRLLCHLTCSLSISAKSQKPASSSDSC